jgi:hypothetical protein
MTQWSNLEYHTDISIKGITGTTNIFKTDEEFVLWDITPCSPTDVDRRFGGTYHLHLQGRSISQARNKREIRWQAELLILGYDVI